jgi:hypothetical protein
MDDDNQFDEYQDLIQGRRYEVSSLVDSLPSSSTSGTKKQQTTTNKRTCSALWWMTEEGVDIAKIQSSLKKITWKESVFSFSKAGRGTKKLYDDEKQLFDKFCRNYIFQLLLQDPSIDTFKSFTRSLQDDLVYKNEEKGVISSLWVCTENYFNKYFTSQISNNSFRAETPKKKFMGSKGYYLYKSYKDMRSEILKDWMKIFWRPSTTVTNKALLFINPALERARCM